LIIAAARDTCGGVANEPITSAMAEGAAGAAKMASEVFKKNLDYSEASLEQLDGILDTLHRRYFGRGFFAKLAGRKMNLETQVRVCMMLGAYVGEVLRRKHGGEWVEDEAARKGAGPALRVPYGENFAELRPVGKVYKRLVDGPGDSIPFYAKTTDALMRGELKPEPI
jgi:hypothetical protein